MVRIQPDRFRLLLLVIRHARPTLAEVPLAELSFGRTPPTPETARQIGCDVPAWAKNGWVDFVTVSEFLFERGDLPVGEWKRAVTTVPVYGGIEVVWHNKPEGARALSAEDYRQQARKLFEAGAHGVYIFNMFTCRESAPWNEPPFEVLRDLGR